MTAPDNELPGQPPHVAASALLVTNESGLTLPSPPVELVLPGGLESGESPAADVELTLQADEISDVFWLSEVRRSNGIRHLAGTGSRPPSRRALRAGLRTWTPRDLSPDPRIAGRVLVPAREIAELSRGRRAGVAAEREVYWGA